LVAAIKHRSLPVAVVRDCDANERDLWTRSVQDRISNTRNRHVVVLQVTHWRSRSCGLASSASRGALCRSGAHTFHHRARAGLATDDRRSMLSASGGVRVDAVLRRHPSSDAGAE
jgi:hypothetical protein